MKTDFGHHLILVHGRSDVETEGALGTSMRVRVEFLSQVPNGFVQALVEEAYRRCPLAALCRPERVQVSVISGSGIWNLRMGPANP